MRFVAIFFALMLGAAHAQTPAERLGPQFLFGWTVPEQKTVVKALRMLELDHEVDPRGITDYELARQKRIIEAVENGYLFYDQHWRPIQPFVFRTDWGQSWSIIHLSLPMTILTGFAVSRYSCRAEDQDTDDEVDARAYCADENRRFKKLFAEHFKNKRAIWPGGKK